MANRLAGESSPYLRQHAENPVDWYPWSDEALARAKAEDKPILLSVGYSACHWCHVMEHESFSDAAVAGRMNRDFVNIKVDREERPDLDALYMQAVQAFTRGHGGWPMTVFLTPEGQPFFGGTYFPPEPRHGLPGFAQVLAHANELYRNRQTDVQTVTRQVIDLLEDAEALPHGAARLRDDWLDQVAAACDRAYDAANGGFGGAPKFPPHALLQALLAHHHRSGAERSLVLVTGTLDAMIRGGLYDHLACGFARYAVDAEWKIPHFEKMLYDNAQLVPVLLDAFRITGTAAYARIARETLDFVARELTSAEGLFFSAFDADSEGEEGRYYVWTPKQLRDVLGLAAGTRVATLLQVLDDGSFEHGTSVLRLEEPLEALDPRDRAALEDAFPKLLAARTKRVPPARDDKAITAWNALMITAFAKGAQVLGATRYEALATRAGRFLLDHVRVNGRLMRSWKDGTAKIPAFLDDHACLLQALVDLYETTLDLEWLREADALAIEMLALFGDDEGGLWYTGMDAEPLVVRTRKLIGGAEPSGAAVAALSLLRLEALSGRQDLGDRAERMLRAVQDLLDRAPRALGIEAVAGSWRSGSPMALGLVGERGDAALQSMVSELRRRYLPFAVVARIDPGSEPPELPWMEGRDALDGRTTAYLCEGRACQLPTTEPSGLAAQLDAIGGPPNAAREAPR